MCMAPARSFYSAFRLMAIAKEVLSSGVSNILLKYVFNIPPNFSFYYISLLIKLTNVSASSIIVLDWYEFLSTGVMNFIR